MPEYPAIKYNINGKNKEYKADLYKNKNCIILEAKERYNGGKNSKYYTDLKSMIKNRKGKKVRV